MTQHPASYGRPSRLRLATALTVAGAILGAALLWPGDRDPVSLDLVQVTLGDGRPLYVGRTEITVAQWSACHADGGCTLDLRVPGEGQDFPATGISFVDAQEFIAWLNAGSGLQYRLPTKAEWYALADEVLPEIPDPIFTAPELHWASAYLVEAPNADRALHPTGDFSTTSTGLRDLDGNVWEWTQDCYDGDRARADPGSCPAFIMGGLHESMMFYLVRDPANGGCASGLPPAHLGFRLVTETRPEVAS
jgi:formylglycine-generating enzyme required for sulfatase activity